MKTNVNFKQAMKAGALAAASAAIINTVLYYIFHSAGIIADSVIVQSNQPLTVMPVIMSSVLPALLASIVFFLIEKFSKSGFKIFAILSIILGVISLSGPFMALPNVPFSYVIVLDIMHVVVVSALLYFISKAVKNSNFFSNRYQ